MIEAMTIQSTNVFEAQTMPIERYTPCMGQKGFLPMVLYLIEGKVWYRR